MGASYDPALTTDKDQVRFLIGDTDETRAVFEDEEIAWVLTQEMNVYTSAASLCDQLAIGAGGGIKSKKISEFSISYDPMFYRELSGKLRARGSGYQVPFAGGILKSEKDVLKGNADWVTPLIPRGITENPDAPKPSQPPSNPLTTI